MIRTNASDFQNPPTLAGYTQSRNSRGASAHASLWLRSRSDIRLLLRGLAYAALAIGGLLAGQLVADALRLVAAWPPAILCLGGFGCAILYIVRDLQRAFRRAEARRRLSEVMGCDLDAAGNENLAGARPARSVIQGTDCL